MYVDGSNMIKKKRKKWEPWYRKTHMLIAGAFLLLMVLGGCEPAGQGAEPKAGQQEQESSEAAKQQERKSSETAKQQVQKSPETTQQQKQESPETIKQQEQKSSETEKQQGQESSETTKKQELQKAGSMEEVLAGYRPALVTLRSAGNEPERKEGSGFIIEMQKDNIYICTNRHVIENSDDWLIGFWDGTKAQGTKTGVSLTYDVGIVQVGREQLPDGLWESLFKLEFDFEYWQELKGGQEEVGFVSLYQSDEGDEYVTGILLDTLAEFSWENKLPQSEFQIYFVNGDSGSAIFDRSGHWISMVYGTSYEDGTGRGRRWGVPLPAILDCYLEIVGGRRGSDG